MMEIYNINRKMANGGNTREITVGMFVAPLRIGFDYEIISM